MNKEELINKWLDSGLNDIELKEFEKLPEYNAFTKLSEYAPLFKDDSYNL